MPKILLVEDNENEQGYALQTAPTEGIYCCHCA